MIACYVCQRPLTGKLDTFGAIDYPVCLECWVRGPNWDDIEDEFAAVVAGLPVEDDREICPHCGSLSLYDKTDAGYPGLYHCADCRAWVDKQGHSTWKWEGM